MSHMEYAQHIHPHTQNLLSHLQTTYNLQACDIKKKLKRKSCFQLKKNQMVHLEQFAFDTNINDIRRKFRMGS